MPAEKRWPRKQNIQFSDAELEWVKAEAVRRSTSVPSVIRALIDAAMTAESRREEAA